MQGESSSLPSSELCSSSCCLPVRVYLMQVSWMAGRVERRRSSCALGPRAPTRPRRGCTRRGTVCQHGARRVGWSARRGPRRLDRLSPPAPSPDTRWEWPKQTLRGYVVEVGQTKGGYGRARKNDRALGQWVACLGARAVGRNDRPPSMTVEGGAGGQTQAAEETVAVAVAVVDGRLGLKEEVFDGITSILKLREGGKKGLERCPPDSRRSAVSRVRQMTTARRYQAFLEEGLSRENVAQGCSADRSRRGCKHTV